MDRLQKILSQAGIASRRASERLIVEGRVTVNGATVVELGTKADASRDEIRVDGRRIRLPERHRYILMNKPRGYVTTRSDPQGRPTVIALLGIHEYVYPVGRLDFESEGLLLLTNDGDLAARLTHPSHGVERVYEARVLGLPDDHDLRRLRQGVVIDGRKTEPADVTVISGRDAALRPSDRRSVGARRSQGRQARNRSERGGVKAHAREPGTAAERWSRTARAVMRITIREGRNRQVRKMFDAIGHPVEHLARVAIGPIRDKRLRPGQWRDLMAEEVERLRQAAARRVASVHRPR
jgi:pseudouridine synthase